MRSSIFDYSVMGYKEDYVVPVCSFEQVLHNFCLLTFSKCHHCQYSIVAWVRIIPSATDVKLKKKKLSHR